MIHNKFNVVVIFLLSMTSCTSCMKNTYYGVSLDVAKQETLISEIEGKIITNGIISFICFQNDTFKIVRYSCQIHLQTKSVSCQKLDEVVLDINHTPIKYMRYYTSASFKSNIENQGSVKYYKYFSDDFLDLSNDDKIKVLDSISSNGLQK